VAPEAYRVDAADIGGRESVCAGSADDRGDGLEITANTQTVMGNYDWLAGVIGRHKKSE